MATPQIRGFAAQMRDLRKRARAVMEDVASEAQSVHDEFHAEVAAVRSEIAEVKALTAEIRGDRAETGNGGPPLDDAPLSSSPSVPSTPDPVRQLLPSEGLALVGAPERV